MSRQFEIAKQIIEETCPKLNVNYSWVASDCLPKSSNARNIRKEM